MNNILWNNDVLYRKLWLKWAGITLTTPLVKTCRTLFTAADSIIQQRVRNVPVCAQTVRHAKINLKL